MSVVLLKFFIICPIFFFSLFLFLFLFMKLHTHTHTTTHKQHTYLIRNHFDVTWKFSLLLPFKCAWLLFLFKNARTREKKNFYFYTRCEFYCFPSFSIFLRWFGTLAVWHTYTHCTTTHHHEYPLICIEFLFSFFARVVILFVWRYFFRLFFLLLSHLFNRICITFFFFCCCWMLFCT